MPLNAAMAANLVVAMIAGLVAAFIYLWNTNEGFCNFWIGLWEKIKTTSGTAVDWIKSKFDGLTAALTVAKTVFGGIKDTITEKIESAREAVDKAVGKIKGFFPLKVGKIFSGLKIPSITVSGGKAPYGIAGKEAVAPIDTLQDYVRSAVRAENDGIREIIVEQLQRLIEFLSGAIPQGVHLDSGALVGELTPAIDYQLSARWAQAQRGNTR